MDPQMITEEFVLETQKKIRLRHEGNNRRGRSFIHFRRRIKSEY